MSYHGSLGQDATFSLEEVQYRTAHPAATDAEVAAYLAAHPTGVAAPAPTAAKSASLPIFPSTGKSGSAPSAPITSAVLAPDASAGGSPGWIPWAIGGTVAALGLGLVLVARR